MQDEQTHIVKRRKPHRIPARYVLAIIGSSVMVVTYILIVNLSIAIINMVNEETLAAWIEGQEINDTGFKNYIRAIRANCLTMETLRSFDRLAKRGIESQEISGRAICPDIEDESELILDYVKGDGKLEWTPQILGIVEGAYFWTYCAFLIPFGVFAGRISPKWTVFAGVSISMVGAIITPQAAKFHPSGLLATRLLQGIGGAAVVPAMHALLAKWTPASERTMIADIVYSGVPLGIAIGYIMSGSIMIAFPWDVVFYAEGFLCAPLLGVWAWYIADTPAKDKYITTKERRYIELSLKDEYGRQSVYGIPWLSILRSTSFWAILISHACFSFGFFMFLLELPFYLFTALHFDVQKNGFISAIPFLSMWLFSLTLGYIFSSLRERNRIKDITSRKISTVISSVFPMICLIFLMFYICKKFPALFMITIALTTMGASFGGFYITHLDISPKYSGLLMGITNCIASLSAIIAPLVVGKLLSDFNDVHSWRLVFLITTALFAVQAAIFFIFGTTDVQKWNFIDSQEALQNEERL